MEGANLINRGFSLIEIVLASTISVILIVPLILLYQQSLHETQQSFDEIQAMLLAREVIDEFHTLSQSVSFDSISLLGSSPNSDNFIDLSQLPHTKPLIKNDHISSHTRALSTFNLSPLPANYQRLVKVSPANSSTSTKNYTPYMQLLSLEVIIRWKTLRAENYNRDVRLQSLIALDDVKPEF